MARHWIIPKGDLEQVVRELRLTSIYGCRWSHCCASTIFVSQNGSTCALKDIAFVLRTVRDDELICMLWKVAAMES